MSHPSVYSTTNTKPPVPLFPLGALLLPDASLPLQIFEPRYLMMVSRCTRENEGFVVMLGEPAVGRSSLGCYGRIVDFRQLDNGLLGITVQGEARVNVTTTERDATGLWWGRVECLPESSINAPEEEACLSRYQPLLDALAQHPYLVAQDAVSLETPRASIHQLMVWLPLEADVKRSLLLENDFVQRCRLLDRVLNDMAGSEGG